MRINNEPRKKDEFRTHSNIQITAPWTNFYEKLLLRSVGTPSMHLCIKHLQQSQNKSLLLQSQNKLNEIILTEREKKKKISNVK